MTSEELNAHVEQQIRRVRERILGIGHEQYAQEENQKFETMELSELFEYAHEELDDIIVYAVMLQIRLSRVHARLIDHPETGGQL